MGAVFQLVPGLGPEDGEAMTKQALESPAVMLLRLVWDEAQKASPMSWGRLNHAMAQALSLVIGAGMQFRVTDFAIVETEFGFGYWSGSDNTHNFGERFYSSAIRNGNLSACHAWEQYRNRPPFIANDVRADGGSGYVHASAFMSSRSRLGLGFTFPWHDCAPTVTSFAADGSSLTACTYREKPSATECATCGHLPYMYERTKIASRFTITPADLRREHKAKRPAEEVPGE